MRKLLKRILADYLTHGCVTHGAALAFYALFVLLPVPIFVVSGAAALVGSDLARAEVVEVLRALAGDQMAVTLSQALESANELTSWHGVKLFGLASVVFGSTAFFVELQETLNKIWGVPATGFGWWSFWRSRFVSFAMVAAMGAILLFLTVLGAAVRGFGDRLKVALPLPTIMFSVGGLLIALVVIAAIFSFVFRYVPDAEVAFKDVWLGSLGTAVLFVVGNELINLYLRYTKLATAYGAARSLVLTLTWIYYSALAFLFGAELTRILGVRRGADNTT